MSGSSLIAEVNSSVAGSTVAMKAASTPAIAFSRAATSRRSVAASRPA